VINFVGFVLTLRRETLDFRLNLTNRRDSSRDEARFGNIHQLPLLLYALSR
jgi:hypothetical protein